MPTTGFVFFGAASAHDLARHWWLFALRGLFAVLFGILAILAPGLTLASLLIVFGAYMILDGVLAAGSAFTALRAGYPWGAQAAEAVLCLLAAALVLLWPGLSLLVAVTVIGVWAIFSGAALLVVAFRFGRGAWLLGLAAVLSIGIGALLLIEPVAGAVVLATWLGVYALLFGFMLIGLAWRLRRLHEHAGAAWR